MPDFLDSLAFRLGALRKGGERDVDTALNFFLKQFREGKLGRWTLDDVDGLEGAFMARHAPEQVGSGIVVSELGAVGAKATGGEGQPAVNGSEAPPLPLTLDDRIALTVGAFLARAEEEKSDADAGRNVSATQQKKAELRAKVEFRLAKAKSKGLDRPGGGRPVRSFGYKAAKGGRTGAKAKKRR